MDTVTTGMSDDADTTEAKCEAVTSMSRTRVQGKLLTDILVERRRQDIRWGHAADRHLSMPVYVAVLTEEVGEVARAILEKSPEQLKAELTQVAAVALCMLEALEAEKPNVPWR